MTNVIRFLLLVVAGMGLFSYQYSKQKEKIEKVNVAVTEGVEEQITYETYSQLKMIENRFDKILYFEDVKVSPQRRGASFEIVPVELEKSDIYLKTVFIDGKKCLKQVRVVSNKKEYIIKKVELLSQEYQNDTAMNIYMNTNCFDNT